MARSKDIAEFGVSVSFGDVIKQIEEVEKALSRATSKAGKGLMGEIMSSSRKMQSQFTAIYKSALEAGLSKANLKGLEDSFKKASKPMEDAWAKADKLNQKINAERIRAAEYEEKLKDKGLSDRERRMLKMRQQEANTRRQGFEQEAKSQSKLLKKARSAFQDSFKERTTGESKIIQRRMQGLKQYTKAARKSMMDVAKGFGDKIKGAFKGIKGGGKGGGGGIKNMIGGGTKGMAGGMKAMMGGAKMAAMMGAMTAAMAVLAGAVVVIAGVVLAIGALIKILIDADNQFKEFNKTTLNGVGAMELMHGPMDSLYDRFKNLNDAASDFKNNLRKGIDAKQFLETANAFSQAGFTYNEMVKSVGYGTSEVVAYQNAVNKAVDVSRMLGISSTEAAGNMGEMMQEFGYSLETVSEKFVNIAAAANSAGFATKKFYSQVLSATSGMAGYNVRINETGNLLVNLSKILGARMAGDLVGNLSKGFTDESMKDRVKRMYKTGHGTTKKVIARDAERSVANFTEANASGMAGGMKGLANDLPERLADSMRTAIDNKDNKKIAEILSKMTPDEQAKFLAKAKLRDTSDGKANYQALRSLVNLSQGMSGNQKDMALAMEDLSSGGKLVMQMKSANAIIGDDIHKMSLTQLMAMEELSGFSGEQLRAMRQLSEHSAGARDLLMDSNEQQKFMAMDPATRKAEQERQLKEFGAAMQVVTDAQGNKSVKLFQGSVQTMADGITKVRIDESKEVKTKDDFTYALADSVKSLGDPMKVSEAMSRQIAANTQDVASILKNGVVWVLNKIHGVVAYIQSFFGTEQFTAEQRASVRGATKLSLQKEMDASNKIMQLEAKIQEQETIRDTSQDDGERAAAAQTLINQKLELTKLMDERDRAKDAQDNMMDMVDKSTSDSSWMSDGRFEDDNKFMIQRLVAGTGKMGKDGKFIEAQYEDVEVASTKEQRDQIAAARARGDNTYKVRKFEQGESLLRAQMYGDLDLASQTGGLDGGIDLSDLSEQVKTRNGHMWIGGSTDVNMGMLGGSSNAFNAGGVKTISETLDDKTIGVHEGADFAPRDFAKSHKNRDSLSGRANIARYANSERRSAKAMQAIGLEVTEGGGNVSVAGVGTRKVGKWYQDTNSAHSGNADATYYNPDADSDNMMMNRRKKRSVLGQWGENGENTVEGADNKKYFAALLAEIASTDSSDTARLEELGKEMNLSLFIAELAESHKAMTAALSESGNGISWDFVESQTETGVTAAVEEQTALTIADSQARDRIISKYRKASSKEFEKQTGALGDIRDALNKQAARDDQRLRLDLEKIEQGLSRTAAGKRFMSGEATSTDVVNIGRKAKNYYDNKGEAAFGTLSPGLQAAGQSQGVVLKGTVSTRSADPNAWGEWETSNKRLSTQISDVMGDLAKGPMSRAWAFWASKNGIGSIHEFTGTWAKFQDAVKGGWLKTADANWGSAAGPWPGHINFGTSKTADEFAEEIAAQVGNPRRTQDATILAGGQLVMGAPDDNISLWKDRGPRGRGGSGNTINFYTNTQAEVVAGLEFLIKRGVM